MSDSTPPESESISSSGAATQLLSPAEVGEYISFNQCPRYAKHAIQDIEGSQTHNRNEFTEAFNPLNLLLSKAGAEYEEQVCNRLDTHTRVSLDFETGDESFEENHQSLCEQIRRAVDSEQPWGSEPVALYQAGISGEVAGWPVRGDADIILVWATTDGAEVRVIDIKRASEEQTYHQVQAAMYVDLIDGILEEFPHIDPETVALSGGIIIQESEFTPPSRERLPEFDPEPRIMDVRRLLQSDGDLTEALETDFENVPYQLDGVCHGCPYNEGCVTDSFETGAPRVLGLSIAQQRQFAEADVESLSDIASLCRFPDVDEWKPTSYTDVSWKKSSYDDLESAPGVGQLLPQVAYRAKAVTDSLGSGENGVANRPRNWLPRTGRCELPDDEPGEESPFSHEWKHGSLVRIYLNVQYDHLRDRVVQVSGRVTASISEANPQRVSVLTEAVPDIKNGADKYERDLLERFADTLGEAVQTVTDRIDLGDAAHENPPVHFYFYSEDEQTALTEAVDRHDGVEQIQALRTAIEGTERPDDTMVSIVESEVRDHLILETPSSSLLHVYEEVQPPSDAYSKPRGTEAWSYQPPDRTDPLHLREVFGRRFFNIGVDYEDSAGSGISVDPETPNPVDGLNIRMRYGADVPLAYVWAAVGRIDESWEEEVQDSQLAEFELASYRYRTDQEEFLVEEDLEALGRHLCDALEHVERALVYKSARIEKSPFPVDSLTTDTYSPPTLATGARRYLSAEYENSREEKYQVYQQSPKQRILAGESLPVYVIDVEEVNGATLRVEGRLRYDDQTLFGENAAQVKRSCRQKEGAWMVANPFEPGQMETEMTRPYELEQGITATIESLNLNSDQITFTLRRYTNVAEAFGCHHRWWTEAAGQDTGDSNYTHVEPGDWYILDPRTDDIGSERAWEALEHAEANSLHECFEGIRSGQVPRPTTQVFADEVSLQRLPAPDGHDHNWDGDATDPVAQFASWVRAEIGPDTMPSERQQSFITNTDAQVLGLQGPPGTGKTAGAMTPALLARAYGASIEETGLNGLVTAPSNTAIDELLEDTAELLIKARSAGPLAHVPSDVELVRIGPEPDEPVQGVTYVDYNDDDDAAELTRLTERLNSSGTPTGVASGAGGDGSGKTETSQATFGAFNGGGTSETDGDSAGGPERSPQVTIVFATPSRTWRLLREFVSGSDVEPRDQAEQSLWHLMAVDEASMMEIHQCLLAGTAFRPDGQLLVGGDHRQLPPVQTHDWDNVQRRDIRSTGAYLSTLDYLRLLRGEDGVVGEEQLTGFNRGSSPSEVCVPLVKLSTTFRFGGETASLMQQTIYEQDGIDYTSGREPDPLPRVRDLPAPIEPLFVDDTSIALVTYTPERRYQQWNPIESVLTRAIIAQTERETDVGVVTPHNAQRGRVQSALKADSDISAEQLATKTGTDQRDIQIETVNRFQGGEKDLMVVNATVSDPNYIEAESDFLLQENRINVSLTRHRDTLVVLAPKSILGHIAADIDLYEDACIWKELASTAGEAPICDGETAWDGPLGKFLVEAGFSDDDLDNNLRAELDTTIEVYTY